MQKTKLLIMLLLLSVLTACNPANKQPNDTNEEVDTSEETNLEDTSNETEDDAQSEDNVKESIFGEGVLKNVEYSNVQAIIEYLDDGDYQLKIHIEQMDDITFDTENQNVYADLYISSEKLDNNEMPRHKNTENLYPVKLVDNKIPSLTEILINKDSDLLSQEEHEAILNKDPSLTLSVQIRDPEGYILQVSNTIFDDN